MNSGWGDVLKSPLYRAAGDHWRAFILIGVTPYPTGVVRNLPAMTFDKAELRRAGCCYDNGFMEPGFGTLKTELEMTEYQHQRAARREFGTDTADDNLERKHSARGYLAPHQF